MPEAFLRQTDHHTPGEYALEELLSCPGDQLESLDANRLSKTPAHLVASFLERFDVDDRRRVLRLLDEEAAMEILAQMDCEDTAEVVSAMREWRALKILESMDPDDAADVVGELEPGDRERLMKKLDPETAETVRTLLTYDEDTAGGVMNPVVAKVRSYGTVDEAIHEIRELSQKYEHASHIAYIYTVDADDRLEGVVSLRQLILAHPYQKISEIAQTQLQGVCHVNDDREEVAHALADLDLSALPVVDDDRHLLGVVTYDDVIDILQDEATEDLQILVGAGKSESIRDSIGYSVSRRGPWLVVNLVTAFMAGGVIACFRPQIEEFALLAVFTPIVASLGGNTGAQTLAVTIRSLATGELQPTDSWHVCFHEAAKGLINGCIIGGIASGIAWMTTRHTLLAGVVFMASLMNMILAGLIGAFIPLLLKRCHLDPAQSSSIFLTAFTDIVGFFLVLSLGAWFIL